jgi:hypothetical protein
MRRRHRFRVAGEPASTNGASSLHLWWGLPPATPPLVSVSVTLEVLVPPAVPRLVFWALQASFGGGAFHLGLQSHPAHPGGRAVNFGGYAAGGRELDGSGSSLPSATGNPNTRDFPWSAGRPHRLTIRRGRDGWDGLVDDVLVRTLFAGGASLTSPAVWSEVFCRCDDPSVAARWSGFSGTGADGSVVRPRALRVGYQSVAAGGCSNTTARLDGTGVVQETNTARVVPDGAWLIPGS